MYLVVNYVWESRALVQVQLSAIFKEFFTINSVEYTKIKKGIVHL